MPWTKEERRASTSKGHHEIWINHLRDHVGELRSREFRTVDASRMLRAIAKERDLTKTTLQHIQRGQSRTARDSANSRGYPSAVVRMARVPARTRLGLVSDGSSGQGGATHPAPPETTRYQGTLHQGLRSHRGGLMARSSRTDGTSFQEPRKELSTACSESSAPE